MRKWIRYSTMAAAFLLSLGLIVLLYAARSEMRKSDDDLRRSFEESGVALTVHRSEFNGRPIRFIESGRSDSVAPLLVFIHGAPGGCDAFSAYLKDSTMRTHFRMISLDRLGYGYSDYGQAEPSIDVHAQMVVDIASRYRNPDVYWIGHSYGGPICLSAAVRDKERSRGSVLIAPAVSPEDEKIFWVSELPTKGVFKRICSNDLKVASAEKMSHVEALRVVAVTWSQSTTPVLYIHGTKDRLVPYANFAYLEKRIQRERLHVHEMTGASHFIPWTAFAYIRDAIVAFATEDSTPSR